MPGVSVLCGRRCRVVLLLLRRLFKVSEVLGPSVATGRNDFVPLIQEFIPVSVKQNVLGFHSTQITLVVPSRV